MRTTFNVPFSKLGTADLRIPLSANPRYHYDRDARCVRVSHDPLPKLAHDAMPAQDMRRARDQEQPDNNGALPEQIRMFLRERLDPEDWQALCEMLGLDPKDEDYADDNEALTDRLEDDRFKTPDAFGGASDAALSRSQSNFVRDMCARLKYAGP